MMKHFDVVHESVLDVTEDVVIDLRYRCDCTPKTREKIQKAIAKNDLEEFTRLMKDRNYWKDVPKDRFERRINALRESLKKDERTVPLLLGKQISFVVYSFDFTLIDYCNDVYSM